MKKILIILLTVMCLTGCGKKKDELLGTWETNYELGAFGVVTETYEFKEEGKCIKTLDAGTIVTNDCTYEFNEDKSEIRVVWEDKTDKESYSNFSLDKDTLVIGSRTYQRK